MIRLFQGGGSGEIELLDQSMTDPEWKRLKNVTVQLLERQGALEASEFLNEKPFIIHRGTNGFGDEFHVLYMQAPLDAYVQIAEMTEDIQWRAYFQLIAEKLTEVCDRDIRFVVVNLDTNERTAPVDSPILEITSDVIERALRDAERLIATEGATSGVDRLHTAFHGYLRAIAIGASLTVSTNANIAELFKAIRKGHHDFQHASPRKGDIDKIMLSLANIVNTLNPIRNQASVAHPNEELLQEPEAMLVINSIKTLLHYLNARMRS